MSRRARRLRNVQRRDVPRTIANPRFISKLPLNKTVRRPSFGLRAIEDRRRFHHPSSLLRRPRSSFRPYRRPHPLTLSTRPSRLLVNDALPYSQALFTAPASRPRLAFQAPKRVLVCIRRQQRKEVLHALGKAGRSGQRRPRRSELSEISCKG